MRLHAAGGIELKLLNVSVVHCACRNSSSDRKFDRIVSRAFSDLAEFVRLSAHLLAPGGLWLAMKGVMPDDEIARLTEARVRDVLSLRVPDLDAERSLIIMEPV
jgi:16S rRNA (guanine527-N7)-methyltransferase